MVTQTVGEADGGIGGERFEKQPFLEQTAPNGVESAP